MRYLTPPLGTYTALSAQFAGQLRHTHSRLAEFSEEVAFLGGEQTEKMLIEREYATVMRHESKVLDKRWWFGCVEEGIIKWLWGSFGVCCFAVSLRGSDVTSACPMWHSCLHQTSWRWTD